MTIAPNFWKRAFGPLNQGALRASTISLMMTAIGGGTLAIPHVLAQSGFVLGLIFIILGAIAAFWSFSIII